MNSTTSIITKVSIENLKKQSKTLLKSYKFNDTNALERVRVYFKDKKEICLADAQLVIARENGFSSWLALKEKTSKGNKFSLNKIGNAYSYREASEVTKISEERLSELAKEIYTKPDNYLTGTEIKKLWSTYS